MLTPKERTDCLPDRKLTTVFIFGCVIGFVLGLVFLMRRLPPTLSTAAQLCADSPTPDLCALFHGNVNLADGGHR